MVEDHRSVSTIDKGHVIVVSYAFWENRLFLYDSSNISVSLADVGLTSSKMTIDETNGRVVNEEAA